MYISWIRRAEYYIISYGGIRVYCDQFFSISFLFSYFIFFHLTLFHILLLLYCVCAYIKALRADNARALPAKPVFGWRLRDINLEPVEGCGLRVFFNFFSLSIRRHAVFCPLLCTRQRVNAQVEFFPCCAGICDCYCSLYIFLCLLYVEKYILSSGRIVGIYIFLCLGRYSKCFLNVSRLS